MDWLNYHHLHYFWQVAHVGSIARAAEELRLAPPTISGQVKQLEEQLGGKLFHRRGRRLVLTALGQTVYDYANDIFSLGQELISVVRQRPTGRPRRLNVGISDVVAKVVVRQLLEPAFALDEPLRVLCREGSVEDLIHDLAHYRLDVVLSDRPAPEQPGIRAFDHLLGECGLSLYAAPELAAELREGFPASLDGAPAMLPLQNSALRRNLDRWFDAQGVHPRVVAEFADTALLTVFAADGLGFFAVPDVVGPRIGERLGAELVGPATGCCERFYAISVERKLKHPAVVAITDAARGELFR